VRLTIDTPRRVYYRGEEIEGTIRAAYYYGAALANREIRYQLDDGRLHTVRTDEKGEVHFKLPTREYRETRVLSLVVKLPQRNLRSAVNFMLAAQGFSIGVGSVRSVYVAGETFEVTVNTHDAEGKPLGRKLSLKVLERTTLLGKVGERLIEEHALQTAVDDGLVQQTLKLQKGGQYAIRVEGIDRLGNPISGQFLVKISDDRDEVRLRILADTHTYKAGDTATVTLHWREDPALALVTLQGARVLDYRLVPLKSGPNVLEIPITARLAPNFELAAAVMTDARPADDETAEAKPPERFHTASSPFTVRRELRVGIVVRHKGNAERPVRPGDEVEVTVTTTDPQGKPVAAEVSLAMVEQSLLQRFAWPAPPIQEFFRGTRREMAVRTTSSVTFSYTPSTRVTDPRLLEAQWRQQMVRKELPPLQPSQAAKLEKLVRSSGGIGGGSFGGLGGLTVDPFAHDPFAKSTEGAQKDPFDASGEDPFTSSALAATKEKVVESDADAAAAALPSRLVPQETGYFNPAIVTGEDGTATASFVMPERSTAWTLVAKGITTDTLAGETSDELVVKKDLFGQLKLPSAFTDGDVAEVTASVHNDVMEKGRIEVALKTTIAGRTTEEKRTIDVDGKGVQELTFKTSLQRSQPAEGNSMAGGGASAVFELTVAADRQRDVVHREVPILPYGVPVFATAGGSADADTTAWVETPQDMPFQSPSLQVIVGPTLPQSLLDVVLGSAPPCQMQAGRIASTLETATSDLMASLALQQLLSATRDADGPHAGALDRRIRSAIGLLVSSQNEKVGWSWTGRGGMSDRYAAARIVWAMSLAREAGYTVPDNTYTKAVGQLTNQAVAAANSDYDTKAILLHALSTAGKGDFSLANRLYRTRPTLSATALVYLALAFAEMDRRSTAAELLAVLAERNLDAGGSLPSSHSPTQLRALYALASGMVTPQAPETKQLIDWLLAHRTGHRFSPDKATGPATMALCRWSAARPGQAPAYKLAVFVNDVQARVLEVDENSGTQIIEVPDRLLKDGKQRINFQMTGRGHYTYQCILSGFAPADKLADTTTDWQVRRTYRPAPLEVDGREIPRGFDVSQGEHQPLQNKLTQLPVGRLGVVELHVEHADITADTPQQHHEYLTITEPIPNGTTVLEESIGGDFEHFEILPGTITFYMGNRHARSTIQYQLCGYLPGTYRVGPTVARDAHRPDQLAVAAPLSLTVLPPGAKSSDPYRLTPRELYELGEHYFDKGDLKTARIHLAELVDKWDLNAAAYKHVVQMLLAVHLQLGPPFSPRDSAEVVRYFEIVKERWPEEEIPFAKILKVGAAYHEMGEYERSYLIFRATVQNSFLRESGVGGFLEAQGEFLRSVDAMGRLLREYPPEAYIATATYALAQQIYAKAPQADDDEELQQANVGRVDLIRRASAMLEGFLTEYPDDPAADQAAFSAANALLELKAYPEAAAACNRYAKRYPASRLLDTYWYVIGYCHFATKQHQAALEMCGKVAEAQPIDKQTGRPTESPNKWQAVYIMGQIHHSLGQPADAVREYERVKDRFADAAKSIRYFLRKAIELPEVTTFKPDEPVDVELKFRNIAACDVKVYRIDLMAFSMMRRNLGGITQINLAGIRPQYDATVELGDGKDYRDRAHKLPLPLKKEGAYLVVCRGENLHTSGLVLVTPLAIEVEEDGDEGQVRTTVKDRVTGAYLSDVHIQVIGRNNAEFVVGNTDLRGVFVANGIQGSATVIARSAPGRYAFYRGSPAGGGQDHRLLDLVRSSMVPHAGRSRAVTLSGPGADENERRIAAALESPTVIECHEAPLTDVAAFLEDLHGIEVQLDVKALDEVGIDPEVEITADLKGISLRSALRLVLRKLDLTYVIHDEVLMITTPEQAETELATTVYPVGDLMTFRDESGEQWTDFDSLMDLITSTVEPTTWDDVGGPGSIAPLESKVCLVISQTQEVHGQIEDVLAKLRSVDKKLGKDKLLPLKQRPQPGVGRGFGGFGGMGGMGTGMGSFGKPPGRAADGSGELLRGLQQTNKGLQGKQVDRLKL